MSSNRTTFEFIRSLQATTPARIGIGHRGGRYPTRAALQFRKDYAIAKDTVYQDVPEKLVQELGLHELRTLACDRRDYLANTRCGRSLSPESAAWLKAHARQGADVQVLVADGLSCEAFSVNVPQMLPLLTERLEHAGLTLGTPLFVRWARVAVMDAIGDITRPKSSILLIGERPGLGTSDSLSAYFEYAPGLQRVESDRNVLSNIHGRGVPPTEAALMLAEAMMEVVKTQRSGMHVRFQFS